MRTANDQLQYRKVKLELTIRHTLTSNNSTRIKKIVTNRILGVEKRISNERIKIKINNVEITKTETLKTYNNICAHGQKTLAPVYSL